MGALSIFVRDMRIRKVKKYIVGDVLDIGCGSGLFAKYVSPKNYYIGLDRNRSHIGYGWYFGKNRTIKTPKNINFICADIENEKLPVCAKFDTILMTAIIEHVNNPKEVLLKAKNCLKQNGVIVITTPSRFTKKIHTIGSWLRLLGGDAEEEHHDLFDLKRMKNIVNSIGMQVVTYKKFTFGVNQLFLVRHCKKDKILQITQRVKKIEEVL